MALNINFKREKLISRSNYIKQLINTTLFFEINSFILYINSSELVLNKSLYYQENNKAYSPELIVKYINKLTEFQRNNTRALSIIKSIISVDNTERFKDKKTFKELFEVIKATFSKSSLELISRYLDRIIKANYNSFKIINKYTN